MQLRVLRASSTFYYYSTYITTSKLDEGQRVV
jgi:hypothetical protein